MISTIKKILNTDIVIFNERQKKILIDIIIKVLKSNIFIFFVLGLIVSIIDLNRTNWHNLYRSYRTDFIYSTILFILSYYIPFFLAVILNLIIKFSKNEIVKKVFKVIMIITNVLSVIYLLLWHGYGAFLNCRRKVNKLFTL